MGGYRLGGPLFILREHADRDLPGVLERMAEIGFEGVEFVGFFGQTPEAIRKKLDSLGLKAISNHVNINGFIKDPAGVIEAHKILGCEFLTLAWPDNDLRPGSHGFSEAVGNIKALCGICYENGMTPIYHNHDFEFAAEPSFFDIFMEECKNERLCLEPDLGWMAYMNVDQVPYLIKYRDRMPVIHLKDIYARDISKVGPGNRHGGIKANPEKGYFEFRPTGYGMVNFPRLIPYCLDCNPKWFIADHDLAYDRDILADLKLSFDYMKSLLEIAEAVR